MAKFEAKKVELKLVEEKKDFQMSQLESIRRGQAYNLAVQAVIGKANRDSSKFTDGTPNHYAYDQIICDKKEIFSLFVFYYELGKLAQTYSMDEIKGIIG